MRRAWIAIAVIAAWRAFAAAAPRTEALGFDHQLHARDVDVSGAPVIACARCHAIKAGKLVGKPGHAACFGTCHGDPPARATPGQLLALAPERLRLCEDCHAEAALVAPMPRQLRASYPPYTIDPDFAVAFGHASHRAIACTPCHATPETKRARPAAAPAIDAHARCAGCHDTAPLKMTDCALCHRPATGRPRPPQLLEPTISVAAAFSHARHAARGGAGKACTTCHAALLATDDSLLPRPTAATCAAAGCHDGAAAFPVTAACTRCHREPPTGTFTVARPTAPFSHGDHGKSLAGAPCASCHPLGARGEIEVAGHAACAACHASEFGSLHPTICGACHTSTEPWRPLVPDQRPVEHTEFGATLDHGKHPGACASCHSLTTAAQQLRPPRGHAACTTAGCHAVAAGPAPRMTACEACHAPGRERAREAARAAAPWSTRAAFDHAAHARAPDGTAIACASCHTDLHGAEVITLPTPAKATCAPCHDGRAAFSLTGTACTRCYRSPAP